MPSSLCWVAKATLSHYWRHPWQTLFLLTGLIAGVGLWSAVQIINDQARMSYADADSLLGVQATHWVRGASGQGISQAEYIRLRRAGFRQIFPVVEGEVSTHAGDPISIIATDLMALPQQYSDAEESGPKVDITNDWLDFVQPPYRSWVPKQLADELNLQGGDRLKLRDGRSLPPALIQSRRQQGRQIFMDIAAAFEWLNRQHFSYLVVADISPLMLDRLARELPDNLKLVENQQHLDLAQLTQSLHTHLSAMSLLSFAVGLFIVFNAVRFSLWYRRPIFLNLRLMGVSKRELLFAIGLEILLWSVVGTMLGVLLGLQIGIGLLPSLGASLHSLYDATIETQITWQSDTLIKAWLMSAGGLCGALGWPLYQQLKRNCLPAAEVTRVSQDERQSRRHLAMAAASLGIIAILFYPHLSDTVSGFILLGLILLSAAWLLPALLVLALTMLAKVIPEERLLGRWLVSDGWLQLPAFRTAMMALMLAMTANLGVGTLVDSFRSAFVNWIEVRQSADIYLRSPNVDLKQLLDPKQSAEWLATSHQRVGVTDRWQGRRTLIRGVDTEAPDSRTLPLAQWSGKSPEDALQQWREQANTVLANEQAHYLGGLALNDTLTLNTDTGPKAYRVVGFFYDYGTPYFQFYLPYGEVTKRWQSHRSQGIALWLKPNSDPNKIIELAEQAMRAAGAKTGDWISQSQIRLLSLNIFERTFAITAAMNALTLLVAAMALLASLLAILQERLPQFAQWRALGIRWYEQMLIISIPLIIFVFVAWLMAIPLGALLSWLLIHQLNIVSFGWSMPMMWEMAPSWQLLAVILLVVASTLALVGWQLRRRLPEALAQLGELG